jgi:UDP-2,3-diacylglucosamine hydrolase
MQAWFISDIHIKDINERSSIKLLRFLHFLKENKEATHLFLLGDIFDLWVGDSDVFQRKFQGIVDALVELKKKGMSVVYFEGNHDVHIKRFWEGKLGIPVYVDHQIFQLGPHKVRLEHGDYINPNDKNYIKYLSIIRHPHAEKLAHLLPGKLLDEAGNMASRFSRKKSSVRRNRDQNKIKEMIQDYAEKLAKKEDFDYLITGHMHVRDEYKFGKRTSINLGSWYEEPKALCLTDKDYSWKDLD